MALIALLPDIHFGAKKNNPHFLSELVNFFDNTFFPTINERSVDFVVSLGDVFDNRKGVSWEVLDAIQNVFTLVARDYFMIVGNHDATFKNTIKYNGLKTIFGNSDWFDIVDKPIEFDNLLLIPWICDDNKEEVNKALKSSKADIVLGHFELNGYELAKGQRFESKDGMDDRLLQRFKFVGSGHFHQPSSKGNVHYLGAVQELTWADAGEPRGFWLLDTETYKKEFFPNPYRMFYELHYPNDSPDIPENKIIRIIKEVEDKSYTKFEDYVSKVMMKNPIELSIKVKEVQKEEAAVICHNTTESGEFSLKDKISTNVENRDFSENLDKKRINQILLNAHNEAELL